MQVISIKNDQGYYTKIKNESIMRIRKKKTTISNKISIDYRNIRV